MPQLLVCNMVKNCAQVGLKVSIDYFCFCYLLDIQTTANYCAVWKAFGQQQKISKILSNFNILRSHYLRYHIQIAHCIYFSRWSNIKWQVCFNFSSMESHVLALELCWQLRGLTGERERKKESRWDSAVMSMKDCDCSKKAPKNAFESQVYGSV